MRNDDPRDPDRRDPSLFDGSGSRRDDEAYDDRPGETPEGKHHALFDEDSEEGAEELRYEGPITMDGHDEEYEDEGGGGGRLLVTAAIVIGAVIVIVAVAMMMKTGGDDESFAEDRPAEVAALETSPPALPEDDPATNAAASIDYRAIPDGGGELAESDPGGESAAAAQAAPPPAPSRTETARSVPLPPPVERARPVPARQVSGESGESVGALAREGRVSEAAALGRSRLSASSATHTLQVLYSCESANVQRAFRSVLDPELTVLPAGDCYRVCFGAFDTYAEAKAARNRLPSYFAGSGAFPKALDELALR